MEPIFKNEPSFKSVVSKFFLDARKFEICEPAFDDVLTKKLKKECCKDRVIKNFLQFKIKDREIFFGVNNRCALSFATNIMKGLTYQETDAINRISDPFRYSNIIEFIPSKISSYELKPIENKKRDANGNLIDNQKKLAFKTNVMGITTVYSDFYNIWSFKRCECKSLAEKYSEKIDQLKKHTTLLNAPFCINLVEPYFIKKQSLLDFDLKYELINLLLPYTLILPYIIDFTHSLKAKFDFWLTAHSKWNNKLMSKDLYLEFLNLEPFFAKIVHDREGIHKFIISGSYVLKLLDQIDVFSDIDIYISHSQMRTFYRNLKNDCLDTKGFNIWYVNSKIKYVKGSELIEYTVSLNKKSYFHKLIKQFCGSDFHPPQFIIYQRPWRMAELLNENRIFDHENMDTLVADAWNIMDIFDIPMCRNALLFLNTSYYYPEYTRKRSDPYFYEHMKGYKIDITYMDLSYRYTVRINFADHTAEEKEVIEKYFAKHTMNVEFEHDWSILGINYQSGNYLPRQDGDRKDFTRMLRHKKYLSRCKLNAGNVDPNTAKLNFQIPRLKALSFDTAQKNNINVFGFCLCNMTNFLSNYKPFHNKCTHTFNFLTVAALNKTC